MAHFSKPCMDKIDCGGLTLLIQNNPMVDQHRCSDQVILRDFFPHHDFSNMSHFHSGLL